MMVLHDVNEGWRASSVPTVPRERGFRRAWSGIVGCSDDGFQFVEFAFDVGPIIGSSIDL